MTDSDSSRVDRDGIHIDRRLANEIAIEEDLNSNVFGEYRFPSSDRRRLAGWVFVVFGLVALIAIDGWLAGSRRFWCARDLAVLVFVAARR